MDFSLLLDWVTKHIPVAGWPFIAWAAYRVASLATKVEMRLLAAEEMLADTHERIIDVKEDMKSMVISLQSIDENIVKCINQNHNSPASFRDDRRR